MSVAGRCEIQGRPTPHATICGCSTSGRGRGPRVSQPAQLGQQSTPLTSNGTTTLGTFLSNAASDYTSNTDLDVDYCNEPCTENISNIMVNRGANGYDAQAFWTGNPAYEGRVEWNSHYAGGWNSRTKHLLARHELGHIFGLDHVNASSPASVMGEPREHMHTLHTHDKDDINVKY